MRQRATIAMALARDPRLLIAGEPTPALDVTIQAQILDLLARHRAERGMAMLFATHNLGVVAGIADRVAVVYAGRNVETGAVAEVFAHPRHPYTQGLMGSLPRLGQATALRPAGTRLPTIAGAVPSLATGGTMEPLCAELAARHRDGSVAFSEARSFNLDECVGLAPRHPQSCHRYMREHLFAQVDFAPGAIALPDGIAADPHLAADAHEAAISAAGGLDPQVLGLGRNGHIGSDEPTSSLGLRTRVKTLTESTRRANARFFGSDEERPRHAITVGLVTFLDAREVLRLAFGADKADAVRCAIEGPVSALTPGSVLQMRRCVTLILDREAAGGLRLRDYCHEVQPDRAPATV